MLVALASIKGAPGVTSTALTLAAVWPRPVVVLEADPAGGDLAYRCRAAHGGPVYAPKGLLTLAGEVRGGVRSAGVVFDHSQMLACGVNLLQGVNSAGQSRGLDGLWTQVAGACTVADVDVIADLGRIDPTSPVLPLAQSARHLIPVASASLESVMHLSNGLEALAGPLVRHSAVSIRPVLIGPDSHAQRDCADLNDLLARAGMPLAATVPVPYDPKSLTRLEQGEKATGRLGRTLLLRAARQLASTIITQPQAVAL